MAQASNPPKNTPQVMVMVLYVRCTLYVGGSM